jgi:hypothetical protein
MRLDNGQIRWTAYAFNYTLGINRPGIPTPYPGSAAAALWQACPSAEVERPLLSALNDRDRFVAAHVLLVRRMKLRDEKMPGWGYTTDNDGRKYPWTPGLADGSGIPLKGQAPMFGNYNGLRVGLTMGEQEWRDLPASEYSEVLGGCDAVIDPAQFPAVREQWYARFRAFGVTTP